MFTARVAVLLNVEYGVGLIGHDVASDLELIVGPFGQHAASKSHGHACVYVNQSYLFCETRRLDSLIQNKRKRPNCLQTLFILYLVFTKDSNACQTSPTSSRFVISTLQTSWAGIDTLWSI